MKKLLAFLLALIFVLSLVGCSQEIYKLPHDQFCYSADDSQTYELNNNAKQYIIDLLNNASWINDLSNCNSDFVFSTQAQEIRYHSECGTFNDYTNQKSMAVSEEQRTAINTMLGIN